MSRSERNQLTVHASPKELEAFWKPLKGGLLRSIETSRRVQLDSSAREGRANFCVFQSLDIL